MYGKYDKSLIPGAPWSFILSHLYMFSCTGENSCKTDGQDDIMTRQAEGCSSAGFKFSMNYIGAIIRTYEYLYTQE